MSEFMKLTNVDSVTEFLENGTKYDYEKQLVFFFPPKSLMLNGVKLSEIFVYVAFSYEYYHSYYHVHSMLRMIAYQSVVLAALTSTSMLSLILAWLFEKNYIFLQLSLYSDMIISYFSIMMLYPLICNQMLSRMYCDIWRRAFNKSRIIFLVSLCATLACVAAVILIQTSEMKRLYIKKIGFVDSGTPGYQMLINRLFYIFPFGSIICYIVLYFHIRRMTQQAMSRRTAENGNQRVYIQLFITILFYGTMCALFEFLNNKEWSNNAMGKVDLVAVLNIINYLPEISLPLMLLLSNTDMRRRISTILGPRSNNASVSVVPLA